MVQESLQPWSRVSLHRAGQRPADEVAPAGRGLFLVDDDPDVRKALTRLLDSAGYRVEAFASATEFLRQAGRWQWGCLLLDLQLPDATGLEVQQALRRSGGALSVVFISGHGDVSVTAQAMKNGAVDFLPKPVSEQALLDAVDDALERSWRAYQAQRDADSVRESLSRLTPREYQVLCGVVDGKLNKQIAFDLGVGEKTVKVHRGRVMRKMGVHSVAALVRRVGSIDLTERPAAA